MTRWTIERIGLMLAVLTLVVLIARPSLAFQDTEATMGFSENAVQTGSSLSPADALLALNTVQMDGDSRPRVISYFAYIVAIKTRLWLWQFVTPHPSASPLWLLTLLVAPILLFRTLRHIVGPSAAAVGLMLFLMSPGNLSGVLLFFHPGKPLAVLLLISMLWVCVRISQTVPHGEDAPRGHGRYWVGVACLVAVAPFVDEAAVFVSFVPVVWLWPHFRWSAGRRAAANWGWVVVPLVLAAVVIFVAAPMLSTVTIGRRFDMMRYLSAMAHWHRLDVTHFLWQTSTLFGAYLVPWATSHIRVPVTEGPSIWWTAWLAIGVLGLAMRAVLSTSPLAPTMRRVLVLMVLFVALQTVVFVVHDFELVATSFYYGSGFSVLFALCGAVLYAVLIGSGGRASSAIARVAVVMLCTVGVVNTLQLSAWWRSHIAAKQMTYGKYGPPPPEDRLADWQPLIADGLKFIEGPKLSEGDINRSYAQAAPPIGWRESRQIVQRWREGKADILAGEPVTTANVWIVRELGLARRLRRPHERGPIF